MYKGVRRKKVFYSHRTVHVLYINHRHICKEGEEETKKNTNKGEDQRNISIRLWKHGE